MFRCRRTLLLPSGADDAAAAAATALLYCARLLGQLATGRRAAARNNVGFSDTSDKATVSGEACLDVALLLALVGLAATTRMACLRRALRSRSKHTQFRRSHTLAKAYYTADESRRRSSNRGTWQNSNKGKPKTTQAFNKSTKNTKQHAVSTKPSWQTRAPLNQTKEPKRKEKSKPFPIGFRRAREPCTFRSVLSGTRCRWGCLMSAKARYGAGSRGKKSPLVRFAPGSRTAGGVEMRRLWLLVRRRNARS